MEDTRGMKYDAILKKNGIDVSKTDLLMFPPEALTRITDPGAPGYDPRVHDAYTDEGLLLMARSAALNTIPPLLCRKNGLAAEIVAGRFRHACALEINRRAAAGEVLSDGSAAVKLRLPVKLVPLDDADLALVALAENTNRPETIATRAAKIRIAQAQGRSVSEIAHACGFALGTVHSYLALGDLAGAVRKRFESGEIPITAAAKVATLTRAEQMAAIDALLGVPSGDESSNEPNGKPNGKLKKIKTHHVKTAVERVQGGGLPERKAGSKMLARAQIEALRKALGECPDADEVAPDDLLRFVLGERDVLHGYACVHRALQEAGVIMRPRGAA